MNCGSVIATTSPRLLSERAPAPGATSRYRSICRPSGAGKPGASCKKKAVGAVPRWPRCGEVAIRAWWISMNFASCKALKDRVSDPLNSTAVSPFQCAWATFALPNLICQSPGRTLFVGLTAERGSNFRSFDVPCGAPTTGGLGHRTKSPPLSAMSASKLVPGRSQLVPSRTRNRHVRVFR